jgi:uncharacterized protein YodC (DUF2158 family)
LLHAGDCRHQGEILMATFKPGDVVQLKSGGPKMTVDHVDKDHLDKERCFCQWFAGAKLEKGWFPFDSVVPVTDEKA